MRERSSNVWTIDSLSRTFTMLGDDLNERKINDFHLQIKAVSGR